MQTAVLIAAEYFKIGLVATILMDFRPFIHVSVFDFASSGRFAGNARDARRNPSQERYARDSQTFVHFNVWRNCGVSRPVRISYARLAKAHRPAHLADRFKSLNCGETP